MKINNRDAKMTFSQTKAVLQIARQDFAKKFGQNLPKSGVRRLCQNLMTPKNGATKIGSLHFFAISPRFLKGHIADPNFGGSDL